MSVTPEPEYRDGDEIEYTGYELLRSESSSVGQIITVGSEIEHVVSMAYFKIATIDPLDGFVLHGKTTIANRIANLKASLKHKSEFAKELEEFKKIEVDLKDFISLRNMFSHGVLMGVKNGILHYLVTLDPSQQDSDTAVFKMKRVNAVSLKGRALKAKILLAKLRVTFGVTTLHERNVLRAAMSKSRTP